MKKAQGTIIIVILLFVVATVLFAIFNIIGFKIQSELAPEILPDLELNESKQIINDNTNRLPSVFDGLAIFFMIGIWVVGIAAGLMNEEHPMLFGFMILICIAALIAGIYISNMFDEFMLDSDFVAFKVNFPATVWIASHMLELGIMMMLSTILAAVAKNKL